MPRKKGTYYNISIPVPEFQEFIDFVLWKYSSWPDFMRKIMQNESETLDYNKFKAKHGSPPKY